MKKVKKFTSIKNIYSLNKPIATLTVSIKSKKINSLIERYTNEENFNITFGDIVLCSISKTLINFPEFNSNFDRNFKLYKKINLGYAINIGKGPINFTIKDSNEKSLKEISIIIKEFILNHIRGKESGNGVESTFSVTNLSSFDVYMAIPPPLTK